jgi:hypothetical protein
MKKFSVLLAGLLSAGLAQASLVTYNFTASVTGLTEHHPAIGDTDVSSSGYAGFTITVADVLHGSFTLDTSTPLLGSSPFGSGTYNRYDAAAGQNALTAIFDSSSYTVTSTTPGASPSLGTQDQLPGQGTDAAGVGTTRDLNSGGYESFGLTVSDPTGTALTYNHIPTSLSAFPEGTFRFYITTGMAPHALGLTVNGALTSLTQVSAVPEPATYMLLGAGLGLLAWRRRFYASNSA